MADMPKYYHSNERNKKTNANGQAHERTAQIKHAGNNAARISKEI